MNYIIASSRGCDFFREYTKKFLKGCNWFFIESRKDLSLSNIEDINPRYIFFPHWSYIIPEEIYSNFECVIFHMTDVPFGKGGSPLQNLISRGIYETKLTSLRCAKDLDSGPVYIKRDFSLYGSAEEIYIRASELSWDMIKWIVKAEPIPKEQIGKSVLFTRRNPEDGDMKNLATITEVFDYIRMLDAEGYPQAFLETDFFRVEFSRASMKKGHVLADVKITMKDKNDEGK